MKKILSKIYEEEMEFQLRSLKVKVRIIFGMKRMPCFDLSAVEPKKGLNQGFL
jgi:hypothetical protein